MKLTLLGRLGRRLRERPACSGRRSPSPGVAAGTGGHKVFPRLGPAVPLGDDVVDRHLAIAFAAILALVVVAPHHVPLRQHDAPPGSAHVALQPDHARDGEFPGHRAHDGFGDLDVFGLPPEKKHERAPDAADVERFVVLVENQNGIFEQTRLSRSRTSPKAAICLASALGDGPRRRGQLEAAQPPSAVENLLRKPPSRAASRGAKTIQSIAES